jgi:hypothetical protein
MAVLAAVLAAAGAVHIDTETPRGGPHRVNVSGLEPTVLDALRDPRAAATALSVFTLDPETHAGLPAVDGTYVVDEAGLHFLPRFPFVAGIEYTARFRHGRWTARAHFTVAAPDGPAPAVVAVYPTGDVLPANALRVYVHFSRPMRVRDANRHVTLLDPAGRAVPLAFVEVEPGLWDPGHRRLTLVFHPGRVKRGIAPAEAMGAVLVEGGEYRLAVDGALQDDTGMPLGTGFERRFRVAAADRESPRIDDVAVEAPAAVDAPLVVRFPEPLDHALLGRLVWVEDARGAAVAGNAAVEDGETRWTFRPAGGWAPGPYVVRVHPALEDRAGNRFDRPFDRDLGGPADGAPAEAYRIAFTAGSPRPGSTRPAGR